MKRVMKEYYSRMKPYYDDLIAHYGEEKTNIKLKPKMSLTLELQNKRKVGLKHGQQE